MTKIELIFSLFLPSDSNSLGRGKNTDKRLESEVVLTEVQASFICLPISWQVRWTTLALKYLSPMFLSPFRCFALIRAFADSFVDHQNSFPAGPSNSTWSSVSNLPCPHTLCQRQINLPKTPLSFASTGRLSSSISLKTLCSLASLHSP